MSVYAFKLLRIAKDLSKTNPLLAYELERSVRAAMNPGVQRFEAHIESAVATLKSLKTELEKALSEIDTDDAKEFAKFFEDEASAELEQLSSLLKKSGRRAAEEHDAAGVKDFLKGLFKKDKKKDKDKDKEDSFYKNEDPSEMEPSYTMSESDMDEFVEGTKDWQEPSAYVESEAKENKEFFGDVGSLIKLINILRKSPSKDGVKEAIKQTGKLIDKGMKLVKGVRKSEPGPGKVTLEGDETEKSHKPSSDQLEMAVNHYADMLKESVGDESKTIKYLRELFKVAEPFIKEERVASSRRANSRPIFQLKSNDPLPMARGNKILVSYDSSYGWTWEVTDREGYSVVNKPYMSPAEMVEYIEKYAKPDAMAADAIGYFSDLEVDPEGAVHRSSSKLASLARKHPGYRRILQPMLSKLASSV